MNARILSAACAALLLPAALFAAAPSTSRASAGTLPLAAFAAADAGYQSGDWRDDDDRRCGRGRSWGCRRDRRDSRYDRRADRWERDRWERAQYERARWEQERFERSRYRARYGYNDRRYERYDGSAVACLRAGGRVFGAVLVVCVP